MFIVYTLFLSYQLFLPSYNWVQAPSTVFPFSATLYYRPQEGMQVMRCHRFNYQVQMYEISVAPNSGLLGMSSVNAIGMAASHKRFGCFERVELAYIE